MSREVEDLLAREGMDDVDDLMRWARERAANLVPALEGDDELGPLLQRGGEAGDAPPVPEPAPAPNVEQTPIAPRREPSNAAPLPPIPVSTPAVPTDELEIDEIEELDMEELELVDEEPDEEPRPEHTPPPGPPPGPPPVEVSSEDAPPVETPSYGPPDGNEVVPEWKAALMSTQTETDAEAAARVEEASAVRPLPVEPNMPLAQRLEAEEDEISQHRVDLSDLDLGGTGED